MMNPRDIREEIASRIARTPFIADPPFPLPCPSPWPPLPVGRGEVGPPLSDAERDLDELRAEGIDPESLGDEA